MRVKVCRFFWLARSEHHTGCSPAISCGLSIATLLPPTYRRLTVLSLAGCEQLTDRTLAAIAEKCPQLQVLNLSRCDKACRGRGEGTARDGHA